MYIFRTSFEWCVRWTTELLDAVGGTGFIIAAFIIFLVVSLLLVPFRGGRIGGVGEFADFAQYSTYKGKYSNGKWNFGNRTYKGKFERGNSTARAVRKRRHNS